MVFLLVLIVIIFLPIPLKLKFTTFNKDYNVFIYNFSLKKLIEKKTKGVPSKSKKKENPKIENQPKTKKVIDKSGLISSLKNNKFKLKLKFTLLFDYGLDDAFNTAMIFPLLNSISPFLFFILEIPFSIKKYRMSVSPKFNCNFIKLEIESIIFLSIAKIIYMTILILKNISKEEIKND